MYPAIAATESVKIDFILKTEFIMEFIIFSMHLDTIHLGFFHKLGPVETLCFGQNSKL
jgi:hypothetical protein